MMKFALLLISLQTLSSLTGRAQITLPDSATTQLTAIVEEFKNKFHIPGISVGILHNTQIVFSRSMGYTDMENKTLAGTDSKFPIMSVSKTFVATMLMQLVEKGTVKLDDNVKKYVPEYKVKSDGSAPVRTTLLQLATHTSGLPRNTPADAKFSYSFDKWMMTGADSIGAFSTNQELLNSLQFIKLIYPPFDYIHHNDRHYSNLGYSVLGIALERAAKTNFSEYLHKNIFAKLKMNSSGTLTSTTNRTTDKGYRYNDSTGKFEELPPLIINAALYPGGLYSTVNDLAKYISSQYNNDDVLSRDSKAMMRLFKIGWKPAYPYVLHEGALPGYRSIIVFNPSEKTGWIILTNGQDVDFNDINGKLAGIVSQAFRKKTAVPLEKYAGTYILPGGYDTLQILVRNDRLYSGYFDGSETQLTADGENRFKFSGPRGFSMAYEFIADDSAKITMLRLGQFTWYKK